MGSIQERGDKKDRELTYFGLPPFLSRPFLSAERLMGAITGGPGEPLSACVVHGRRDRRFRQWAKFWSSSQDTMRLRRIFQAISRLAAGNGSRHSITTNSRTAGPSGSGRSQR